MNNNINGNQQSFAVGGARPRVPRQQPVPTHGQERANQLGRVADRVIGNPDRDFAREMQGRRERSERARETVCYLANEAQAQNIQFKYRDGKEGFNGAAGDASCFGKMMSTVCNRNSDKIKIDAVVNPTAPAAVDPQLTPEIAEPPVIVVEQPRSSGAIAPKDSFVSAPPEDVGANPELPMADFDPPTPMVHRAHPPSAPPMPSNGIFYVTRAAEAIKDKIAEEARARAADKRNAEELREKLARGKQTQEAWNSSRVETAQYCREFLPSATGYGNGYDNDHNEE